MHACVCDQRQKQSGPPKTSFQNPLFSTLEDYKRHFHNSMMMIQGTQSCLRSILESDPRIKSWLLPTLYKRNKKFLRTPLLVLNWYYLKCLPLPGRYWYEARWYLLPQEPYYIPGKYWHEAGTYCIYPLRSYQSGHTLKLLEFGRDEKRGSGAAGKCGFLI
jgi:hypothetical protein